MKGAAIGLGLDLSLRTHGTGGVLPLVLPVAGASLVMSLVRPDGYTGSSLTVQRASDNATLDIGWVGNTPDQAAADAFAGGSALTVLRAWDASGNGVHLDAPATAANQPAYTALNEHRSIRPITFDGFPGIVAPKYMRSLVSGNRNNVTIFKVYAPRTSYGNNVTIELSDAAFNTANRYGQIYNAQTAMSANFGSGVTYAGAYMRAHMGILGFTAAPSGGTIMRPNGAEFTSPGSPTSQAFGGMQIGISGSGGNFNGREDLLAVVVYPFAMTSVQMQTTEAALQARFVTQTSFTKRLVYNGSSLIDGYFNTLGQTAAWQSGFGRGVDWETFVMAVGGRTLAAEYAARANALSLYDATKSRNVYVLDAPGNDFAVTFADQAAAEAAATTLYTGTTVPYVAAAKVPGFSVVVPTTIAKGSYSLANFREYARLKYNQLVRDGAVANGYTVSDRAANAIFDTPADADNTTFYAADKIHPINAGTAVLGPAIDAVAFELAAA